MKVYIGPYKYRYNTYSIASTISKLFRLDDDKKDVLWIWLEKWLPVWPFRLANRIRGDKRRIDVRIDAYDVWSADHTLALIILPTLIKLQKVKHGSGHVDDEDVPESLRSTSTPPVNTNIGETDEKWHKRWDYVLEQMIWSFDAIVNDDKYDGLFHIKGKPFDKEGFAAHNKRIDEGLRLFGKYYRGLWD